MIDDRIRQSVISNHLPIEHRRVLGPQVNSEDGARAYDVLYKGISMWKESGKF
jgi:hypothetical protein